MLHCKTEAPNQRRYVLTQRGGALIPALLAVLTVTAGSAAVWQWQRSQYHDALLLAATQNAAQPSQQTAFTGVWLANSTVFVTPRIMDARMGAWAVSVLQYADSAGAPRYVAVHRGWMQQTQPNTAPVLAPLSQQTVTVQGDWVDALPMAYALNKQAPTALGLWQNHDLAAHGAIVQRRLEPRILVLSTDSPDADRTVLRRIPAQKTIDVYAEKADKNRGYAAQWLGLGLVGLFGLAWMWLTRRKSKPALVSPPNTNI